ncbi:leukocyte receptor cluster member 1 homolog [Oppia nitens]|uniref:leukocyte receptor cluster member 1 homolog n=1 Tax=Oppia nitens TaxID=1686743 RepID=UPI0023DC8BBA|nr:leukocyte receptor cluster member 1 homolog [Oppia nitens]
MNILRHKSWHVRNRNNIERVRRDEENARKEELAKQRRVDEAECEARVTLLRQRRGLTSLDTAIDSDNSDHKLGVFKDVGDKIETKNIEHEKEVKQERDEFETKTGILKYLVDKDIDGSNNWYLESHEKRMKLIKDDNDNNDLQKQLKDSKLKHMSDPLEVMKKYLDQMRSKNNNNNKNSDNKKYDKRKDLDKCKNSIEKREIQKKSTKHKKQKHKKHKKRKRYSSDSSSSSSSEERSKRLSKSLEQLRAERLEREKTERQRAQELIYGKEVNKEAVVLDDRLRTYNSQFNPEIARQKSDRF